MEQPALGVNLTTNTDTGFGTLWEGNSTGTFSASGTFGANTVFQSKNESGSAAFRYIGIPPFLTVEPATVTLSVFSDEILSFLEFVVIGLISFEIIHTERRHRQDEQERRDREERQREQPENKQRKPNSGIPVDEDAEQQNDDVTQDEEGQR